MKQEIKNCQQLSKMRKSLWKKGTQRDMISREIPGVSAELPYIFCGSKMPIMAQAFKYGKWNLKLYQSLQNYAKVGQKIIIK